MTAPALSQSRPFTWTGEDAVDAGCIAAALRLTGYPANADAVTDHAVELQARRPGKLDAWVFFHAARALKRSRIHSPLAARAQALGARLALAATGLFVVDAHVISCGASAEIVFDEGRNTSADRDQWDRAEAAILSAERELRGMTEAPAPRAQHLSYTAAFEREAIVADSDATGAK